MNKHLKKHIRNNSELLLKSEKDLKAVYNIMFSADSESFLAETNDGFRIKKHTLGEFKEKIERVAGAIYLKLGATHRYIGLEMENDPLWIVAFWAILKSGNKPYLVNRRHPKNLSNGILKTLNIKYIIGDENTSLNAEFLDINKLMQADAPAISSDDEFENEIAISTSATSLNEVICFYSGEEISNQILNARDILCESKFIPADYKGEIKQLAFLPFYHVFGLFAVYFWYGFFGRTIVFLKDYSADTILKTCRKHEVTHIFAVPMLWHTVEKQLQKELQNQGEKKTKKFYRGVKICTALQNISPILGQRLAKKIMGEVTDKLFGPSVMCCISGGSYINQSTLETINALGYPLFNGYGMSEIGITSVELRHKPKYRNLNSVGHPFKSVNYKLDDNNRLYVKGNFVCKRKLVNGKSIDTPEWFETGDIAIEKNGYYYIKGRESDIVIGENGENINPDTIEQLFDIGNIQNLSVLGLRKDGQEELSVVVSISEYLSGKKTAEIIKNIYSINETLPLTSRIKKFYLTHDPIMKESAIKVSRKYLQRAVESFDIKLIPFSDFKIPNQSDDFFDDNGALAKKVKKIVSNELGIPESDISGDAHIMFDLGATSIQYFSILSSLAKEFNITEYSDKENYRYTVREFCEFIERYM